MLPKGQQTFGHHFQINIKATKCLPENVYKKRDILLIQISERIYNGCITYILIDMIVKS